MALWLETLFWCQLILGCLGQDDPTAFPDYFAFGASTAAFTIEGGWNADGKGPSTFDYWAHVKPYLFSYDPADYNLTEQAEITADSYHKWEEDVRIAQELGLDFYQFSISWTRILPRGFLNPINQAGLEYYSNLIDALIAVGIKPVICLLHFDTPELTDRFLGGFSNEIVIQAFVEYADLIFSSYSDRVHYWISINAPYWYCKVIGEFVADANDYFPTGQYEYLCGHNMLRAHAKVYRLFESKYKKSEHDLLTMTNNLEWYEPASDSPEDIEAAARAMDFYFGWFVHPLVHGNYPQRMIDTIAEVSALQNYTESRLPTFTEEEINEIKGAYDYIGVIPVNTYLVSANREVIFPPTVDNDVQVTKRFREEWIDPNSFKVSTPWGFRNSIKYVWDNYGQPMISVDHHGYGAYHDSLNDTFRIQFLQESMEQILSLIYQDGVYIRCYNVWSLIDSFYFQYALVATHGFAHVDFNDPERPRTLKASASYFRQITDSRRLA